MATSSMAKKILLLGLLVAAVVATASCATSETSAQASVSDANPAKMGLSVRIQTSERRGAELHVRNGDVVVVKPNDEDPRDLAVRVLSFTPVRPEEPKPPRGSP